MFNFQFCIHTWLYSKGHKYVDCHEGGPFRLFGYPMYIEIKTTCTVKVASTMLAALVRAPSSGGGRGEASPPNTPSRSHLIVYMIACLFLK